MVIKQALEQYHPYLFGGIAGMVSYRFNLRPIEIDISTWLSAPITFAAILLGFLATAQSILAATPRTPDTTLGRILLIPEYKNWLVSYFHEAFVALTAFTVFNLAGFFVEKPYSQLEISYWFSLRVAGMLAFYRIYLVATK